MHLELESTQQSPLLHFWIADKFNLSLQKHRNGGNII